MSHAGSPVSESVSGHEQVVGLRARCRQGEAEDCQQCRESGSFEGVVHDRLNRNESAVDTHSTPRSACLSGDCVEICRSTRGVFLCIVVMPDEDRRGWEVCENTHRDHRDRQRINNPRKRVGTRGLASVSMKRHLTQSESRRGTLRRARIEKYSGASRSRYRSPQTWKVRATLRQASSCTNLRSRSVDERKRGWLQRNDFSAGHHIFAQRRNVSRFCRKG